MNSIEFEWKIFLSKILEEGEFNEKDDSKVLEILGYHVFIPTPLLKNDFLAQTSDVFIKLLEAGYLDIDGYPMNGESMAEYVKGIRDTNIIFCFTKDDGFVYTYPERLIAMRTWDAKNDKKNVFSQLAIIINRLSNNSGSNRAVATLYNCGLDRNEDDIPCLNWLQAIIRNNELTLHVMFRSNDIYGAWPSNMMFLTNIGLMITEALLKDMPNLRFKGIDYHVSSAHIYETDLDAAKEVL